MGARTTQEEDLIGRKTMHEREYWVQSEARVRGNGGCQKRGNRDKTMQKYGVIGVKTTEE